MAFADLSLSLTAIPLQEGGAGALPQAGNVSVTMDRGRARLLRLPPDTQKHKEINLRSPISYVHFFNEHTPLRPGLRASPLLPPG